MTSKKGEEKAKFQERTLQILEFVRDNEPCSLNEVHANFDLTKGSIGTQLKRLSGQGLLERTKGVVYTYEITGKGEKKIKYIKELRSRMSKGMSYSKAKEKAVSKIY